MNEPLSRQLAACIWRNSTDIHDRAFSTRALARLFYRPTREQMAEFSGAAPGDTPTEKRLRDLETYSRYNHPPRPVRPRCKPDIRLVTQTSMLRFLPIFCTRGHLRKCLRAPDCRTGEICCSTDLSHRRRRAVDDSALGMGFGGAFNSDINPLNMSRIVCGPGMAFGLFKGEADWASLPCLIRNLSHSLPPLLDSCCMYGSLSSCKLIVQPRTYEW